MRFSLIMATYGRKEEIIVFLNSLLAQSYDLNKIEIIIVDQNDVINLDDEIKKFEKKLIIKHIKSDKKGLSFNRNIGLKLAVGEYVAFPDDDCIYYPDTLSNVLEFLCKNPEVDVVLGKIYDRKIDKNIIRDWKNEGYTININNFFLSYSSITIFARQNNIIFDNNLGVGTRFGSYEDADYILQLLKEKKRIEYSPSIEVWHPDLSATIMNYEKIYSYGLGFGALIKKHLSTTMIMLFLKVIGFHLIKTFLAILFFNLSEIKKRYFSIKSRLNGFFLYEAK